MSKEDKIRVIENINTTMKVENLELTDDTRNLLEDLADDKISLAQAIEYVKKSILKRV